MTDKGIEIIEGLVTRGPVNGRRTYSETAKRALVQLSLRPGVSVAGLALAHGINANLLRRWTTQYGGPALKAANARISSPALLPVDTSAATTKLRATAALDCCIEITFMGATIRIRGAVEARALSVVLDCLAQRA